MAFSLPALTAATHVKITIPVDYTVFLPSILLLDENHNAVQTIPSSTFSYDGRSLISGQNIRGNSPFRPPSAATGRLYGDLFHGAGHAR